jgi:hypothetical protein
LYETHEKFRNLVEKVMNKKEKLRSSIDGSISRENGNSYEKFRF